MEGQWFLMEESLGKEEIREIKINEQKRSICHFFFSQSGHKLLKQHFSFLFILMFISTVYVPGIGLNALFKILLLQPREEANSV